MFHFQTLDVYKCAVAFLPVAYSLSKLGDAALAIIGVTDSRIAEGHALLVRIVSMLTKMIG